MGTEKRDPDPPSEVKIGGSSEESAIEGSISCHLLSSRSVVILPISAGPAGMRPTPANRGQLGRDPN